MSNNDRTPQEEFLWGRIIGVLFVVILAFGGLWAYMNRASLSARFGGNNSAAATQSTDTASEERSSTDTHRVASREVSTPQVPVTANGSRKPSAFDNIGSAERPVEVCVVPWGGYVGGQWFNQGFEDTPQSFYVQRYGVHVRFSNVPDPVRSRELWKTSRGCDLLWVTADSLSSESGGLIRDFAFRFIFQSDWSRGGDVWVIGPNIKKFCDIKGHTVAVPQLSPSHSFFFYGLKFCGFTPNDVIASYVNDPGIARDKMLSGDADSAPMWDPYQNEVQAQRPGSKVGLSTKQADHIIADGFIAKEELLRGHRDVIAKVVKGWLIGAAKVNTDQEARKEAEEILVVGYGVKPEEAGPMIDNVRLTTLGDNTEFLGLTSRAGAVTGRQIYTETGIMYQKYFPDIDRPAEWSQIVDSSIIAEINRSGELRGPEHDAEGVKRFEAKPAAEVASMPSVASKTLAVTYETGSAELTEEAKQLLDSKIMPDATLFQGLRIEVTGHTDNTGPASVNQRLSLARAESVKSYLVSKGFDPNRFTVLGKGSSEPVNAYVDNNSPENRAANRRTVFNYK